MNYIQIFATGGTFDKEYNEIDGKLYFKTSNLAELLKLGRSKLNIKVKTLMMLDSLEMHNKDRKTIINKWVVYMRLSLQKKIHNPKK